MDEQLAVYRKTVELAPIEDVAKFMLIAPEKAKAMAAEIRALQNLGMAQEVLAQKEEEQRMLNELILDAGARIGELTKEIPKAQTGPMSKEFCASGATKPKTKEQVGAELGFTRHDMSRFEKLADNKDLIEMEKAKAREEHRQPTRTNVLEAARARDWEKQDKGHGNKQSLVPGGFSKERREQRAQIEAIYAGLKSEPTVEFTSENLVSEINGIVDNFIGSIKTTLAIHSTLIDGVRGQVKEIISEAKNKIEKEVIGIL